MKRVLAAGLFIVVAALGTLSCTTSAAPAETIQPKEHPASAPPAPSAPLAAGITFERWIEPQEHSFTVDVPKGWQLFGGLNWTGPIDPQMYIHAKSADGNVQVFVGDPEILPRQVPSSWTRMQTGTNEGGTFRTPSGGRALVQRFLTGVQFAKAHVTQRLCRDPEWLREVNQPEAAQEANAALASEARAYGVAIQASAGEAGFICKDAVGFAQSTTVLVQSASSPMQFWAVLSVAGFMSSDPARAMQARYVMEHMVATQQKDPQWTQAWEQRVRQVTGAVISMQNAETAAHLRAARSASDTLSRLNHPNPGVSRPRERSNSNVNTTLGTRRVCDAIGRCDTVSNDADTVFMDHSGRVAAGRAGGAPPDNSGVWTEMH